jgi:hypothetical protein
MAKPSPADKKAPSKSGATKSKAAGVAKPKKQKSAHSAASTYQVPVAGIVSAVLTLRELGDVNSFVEACREKDLVVEVSGGLLDLFVEHTNARRAGASSTLKISAAASEENRGKAEAFAEHVVLTVSRNEPDDTESCRRKP